MAIMIGEINLLSYRDVDFYADKKFMSVLAQIPINQTGRNIKVIFCYESLKVKWHYLIGIRTFIQSF